MLKKIRHVLSLVMILVSCFILAWAFIREPRQEMSQYIEPSAMMAPSTGSVGIPTLLEIRQVSLSWPKIMRIGDRAQIVMIFKPASSEILAPQPQGQLSDAYERFNLMAEGRFEVAGVRVEPANATRESLPAGQTVKFTWQISPQDKGTYPCKVWLLLRFLPLQGGQALEVPVFVQEVDIRATSLIGLSGPLARLLGGVGIVLGLLLSYDVMIGMGIRCKRKNNTKDSKDTKDFNY